jgi:hypothetical protein
MPNKRSTSTGNAAIKVVSNELKPISTALPTNAQTKSM